MVKQLVMAFLAIMAWAVPAQAREAEWELLGQQRVGFGVDRDVIRVGGREGTFTSIQLRVRGNDIEVLDLKVRYGNGETDDIPVRAVIRQNGVSGNLDLKGRARVIESIQMIYRSRPNFRGFATVEVWGRRGPGANAPGFGGPGPGPNVGVSGPRPGAVFGFAGAPSGKWERLGTRAVGFRVDRDVIQVGPQQGAFRRVLLRVLNNDIELLDMKIVYGNGSVEDLSWRRVIRAGGHTGVIDLKGNARAIIRVDLMYRSRPNFNGQAVVELWGLHE